MTDSLAVFDYAALEVEARVVVQQKTGEIRERVENIRQKFIEIGARLIEVKARLKHGQWGDWLKAEFGWSQDTAQNLMNAARLVEQNPKFSEFGDQFTREAMYALGAKSTPAAAVEAAVEAAQSGVKINDAAAKQFIAAYKPPTTGGRSGVNFAGEGVEPDLDEDGQPLARRSDELTPEDVPKGTWVRWRGKKFEVRGFNYGSGNLWLVDERGRRSWVPLREVTRIADEVTEERVVEQQVDVDDDDGFRLGDTVEYRGHRCVVVAVASSGRLSLKTAERGQPLHGIDPEQETVTLVERAADRQPPKAAPAAPATALDKRLNDAMDKLYGNGWVGERAWGYMAYITDLRTTGMIERKSNAAMHGFIHLTPKGCRVIGREEIPVAPFPDTPIPAADELRTGDHVITRAGFPGVITRDGGDRRVSVQTVNGESTHLRETLMKVEPPLVPPPLDAIDGVPVAETHPMGWQLFHDEGSWATCVNCGESHARWSAVRGGDWRCEMPNCKRLTHDDLLIPYTKEDADAERRNARRNGGAPKQFTPLPQHLSGSVEWYTPAEYVEAARAVMGDIDLDPASCELANQTVLAGQFYTAAEDGLKQVWSGRVWLNPPYGMTDDGGSSQGAWSARLIRAWEAGEIEEGILLCNAATAQRWFAPLWQYPICFTDHRIRFISPNGDKDQPPHGSAFVYFGNHPDRFAQVFAQFGPVVVRVVRQEAAAQP